MKIKKNFAFFPAVTRVLAFMFVLSLTACSDEEAVNPTGTGGDEKEIVLTLSTGKGLSPTTPSTYALTMTDEATIAGVDVLSFLNDGSGTYYYEKRQQPLSAGGNGYSFKVANHSQSQRFVVLTNASAALTAVTLTPADKLDDVLQKLELANTGEWQGNRIPMYGCTAPLKADTLSRIDLKLIRMLARMDVSVKSGVDFKLTNARLYNIPLNGRVAYSELPTAWDAAKFTVLAPTLPASVQKQEKPAVVFKADASGIIRREIYLFESGKPLNRDHATALVVGGLYNYSTNKNDTTYYRIDIPEFVNGTEQPNSLGEILRNHSYDIKIQGVTGKGSDTPDEAFYTIANMTSKVQDWSLPDIDDAVFMGVNSLRVNQALFTIANNGENNLRLDIETSYDEGCEAWLVPSDADSWLKFTPAPNASRNPDFSRITAGQLQLRFNALTNSSGKDWRHAALKIRSGNLVKYIDFFQSEYRLGNELFDWETADIETGIEMYRLGVSRAAFSLGLNKNDSIEVVATTDFSGGLEVYTEYPNGGNWLSVKGPNKFPSAGTHTIRFAVELNNTGNPRMAYLVIKAGTLLKKIKIDQLIGPELDPSVRPWDDPGFDPETPVIDYWLKTSRSGYLLYRNAYDKVELIVETNQPGGFKVYPENGSWLSVVGNDTFATGQHSVYFAAKQNDSGSPRTAYFVVSSGNMRKKVVINQAITVGPAVLPPLSPWEDPGSEPNIPVESKDFYVNRTACAYDKDAKNSIECVRVTTETGKSWSATSSVPWLTIETPPTTGNGTPQPLKISVDAYPSGADRTGTIILQSDNLQREIKITQYSSTGVQISNLLTEYGYNPDMPNEKHKFRLRTKSPWEATVITDTQNLIRQLHTPSDMGNWTGIDFLFTLNGFASGTKSATIRISSIYNEFNPMDVTIDAKPVLPYFELGGLQVKRNDQPGSQTWYVFANVPNGTNTFDVPPLGQQVTPPRQYSCASYKTDNSSKPWRLPTQAEMAAVIADAKANGGLAAYNFPASGYYYTATSTTGDNTKAIQERTNSSTIYNESKSRTGGGSDFARCVRDI
ncbi:BACON domain-containing protein [Massilibacteroides vaginae]|uniref:BACON domain-containing protein n=1 Tax=Massilibacteroides vaginae TaxID=1673718 RepID=UPI000A1CD75F|nr:BACON domain-containing carbohydrate-binding protein [Massilibacteroides vaginae]